MLAVKESKMRLNKQEKNKQVGEGGVPQGKGDVPQGATLMRYNILTINE
jgi:hypothetical protein